MSFSSEIKQNLCGQFIKKNCCKKSLLLGILRASYLFCDREIRFTTRSYPTAALTEALLGEVFDIRTPFSSAAQEGENESSFSLFLSGDDAQRIADCFSQKPSGFRAAVPEFAEKCQNCRLHYLRGVFLSCGAVTDPKSGYHLDMVLSEDEMAEEFSCFLEELDLPPKHTARKGLPVLYYKENGVIADFLSTIGATKASFDLINAQIRKELRNNANRVSNCELANIDKTVSAATVQYEAIRTLYETKRFSELPEELQETAKLRYENPDLALKDLAGLHEPPLTKSGLNHRLQRIVSFAAAEK